jgi:hypothetical protein
MGRKARNFFAEEFGKSKVLSNLFLSHKYPPRESNNLMELTLYSRRSPLGI